MTLTAESLKRILGRDDKMPIGEIVATTSVVFNVPVRSILGPSRRRNKVKARHAAMYICYQEGHTYAAIGKAMNRDHTTVFSAVKAVQAKIDIELQSIPQMPVAPAAET